MMDFDSPCFKVLASNDTSSAPGHQGGIVIPKEIADFFPELPLKATADTPTVDAELIAELLLDGMPLGEIKTRYQHQTWGGKRSPERRLTSNLGPIRKAAVAGDIILFQRSLLDANRIKISLITRHSSIFEKIAALIGTKRWGALVETPSSNTDMKIAQSEIEQRSSKPFELFTDTVEKVQSNAIRIARSRAFQKAVLKNFRYACAISQRILQSPSGSSGIDAAHIIPLSKRGTNDIRNGIALSKELHWAFDAGIICIMNGKVAVSEFARISSRSDYLLGFDGFPILAASKPQDQPDTAALQWHCENIFVK